MLVRERLMRWKEADPYVVNFNNGGVQGKNRAMKNMQFTEDTEG